MSVNPNLSSQMQFDATDSGTQIGRKLQHKTKEIDGRTSPLGGAQEAFVLSNLMKPDIHFQLSYCYCKTRDIIIMIYFGAIV